MKTLTVQKDHYSLGLQLLADDTKAPFGSARQMINVWITDRGGIGVRPGTAIVGNYNSSPMPVRTLFNFKKANGDSEILIKTYDTEFQFLHPALQTWSRVQNGFTSDQEFGAFYTLVNVDNDDFMYFCNRYEKYSRWRGAYAVTTSVLVGGETSIPVDSTLKTPVYMSDTATSNSATTVTVSTASYATDMYKNFYAYFPGSGKVRKITGNTSTVITFATLGGSPGNVAFQIRMLAFPDTGSIIYNGTVIAYTGIDTATSITVASAHAAPSGTAVAVTPDSYIAAPRGNRMDILKGRPFVGRVRSAVSLDAAGATQGSAQAASVFVAKLLDPTTFTYSASRVAGEGDILNVAYGGHDVNDVVAFEDSVAIYKDDYIEVVQYSQDGNDSAVRTPLKPGVGSVGRVIKGSDDHYFMTLDKRYTSLGRVRTKDLKPQTENIGYIIKRLLDNYNHDNFNGIEFNNRLISCHKTSDDETANNVMVVYNKITKSFEGIWTLGANCFAPYGKSIVFGDSYGANVWQMFKEKKSDVRASGAELPITAKWQSNFGSVVPLKANMQGLCSVALEGYIKPDTSFTYSLFKDFETDSFLSFSFGGSEEEFLMGSDPGAFLGNNPLGLDPVGTIDAPDEDGRRRFSFIVYFPYVYMQYLSSSIESAGKDQDWELIRESFGLKEDISTRTVNTKTI